MESVICIPMLILTTLHVSILAAKLDLTPTHIRNVKNKSCTTKYNKPGICVPEWSCNKYHELEVYGVIDEYEKREQSDCIKGVEWCCSEKSVKTGNEETTSTIIGKAAVTESTSTTTTTTTSTTPSSTSTPSTTSTTTQAPNDQDGEQVRCLFSDGSDCPWCVNLFSADGDFWCMGSLIGSNVVLTTATCLLHMEDQKLFARVPESADPNMDYLVKFQFKHPEYNSGSRLNDLALLTIDEVKWGSPGGKGACYSTDYPFGPDCVAAGVDDDEHIVLTNLTVNQGSCNGRGNVPDVACGKTSGECHVQNGAPIMCPIDNNAYVMLGMAKFSCTPQGSLLGSLQPSETWLMNTLKGVMGLQEKDFLYQLNY